MKRSQLISIIRKVYRKKKNAVVHRFFFFLLLFTIEAMRGGVRSFGILSTLIKYDIDFHLVTFYGVALWIELAYALGTREEGRKGAEEERGMMWICIRKEGGQARVGVKTPYGIRETSCALINFRPRGRTLGSLLAAQRVCVSPHKSLRDPRTYSRDSRARSSS